eukprot:5670731-Alexandrium_andersonii.AAC.1
MPLLNPTPTGKERRRSPQKDSAPQAGVAQCVSKAGPALAPMPRMPEQDEQLHSLMHYSEWARWCKPSGLDLDPQMTMLCPELTLQALNMHTLLIIVFKT